MLLCENKENLVEHGCKAFADIHLLEGAAEVTYTLPEVVEEGANFKEAIVNSAAKCFWKKTVSEQESYANLLYRSIIGQLDLADTNEGLGIQRLRNFRAKKLSCMRLKGIGLCVTYCASFGMSTSEHFICNPSPDS